MPASASILPTEPAAPPAGALLRAVDLPDGARAFEIRRLGAGYLVRFPGLADFTIGADGALACAPAPGVSQATCDHLRDHQLAPLLASRRGALVLHASAVAAPAGALAFLGPAGRGKSTLAASFARAGLPFLSDDALALDEAGGRWRARPGPASLRLWADSRAALARDRAAAPALEFTDKTRLLADAALAHCDAPQPLAAAFVLEEPAPRVTIAPLPPREALLALLAHAFLLDHEDGEAVRAQFDAASRLVDAVPMYRLAASRDYAALPATRAAILACVETHR